MFGPNFEDVVGGLPIILSRFMYKVENQSVLKKMKLVVVGFVTDTL